MVFHFPEHLDLVLVPAGLMLMFSYHLFLLYRYFYLPHKTVMGFENHDKKAWVQKVMQDEHRNELGLSLNVISSNVSAATFLASICLTLCSLIGAWIANSPSGFSNSKVIYGDKSTSTVSIKFLGILTCFLIAFSCFIQSLRHFVHANYLISMPDSNAVEYAQVAIRRASEFWSLGLRALYFALDLLVWFFGPIPMFVCSVVMVFMLHHLDTNSKPFYRHGEEGEMNLIKKKVREHVSETFLSTTEHV